MSAHLGHRAHRGLAVSQELQADLGRRGDPVRAGSQAHLECPAGLERLASQALMARRASLVALHRAHRRLQASLGHRASLVHKDYKVTTDRQAVTANPAR